MENEVYGIKYRNLSIPPVDCDPHILIAPTRKYYFDYIHKILSQNYISHQGKYPPHEIYSITKELELEAAAKSMIVPLYRKAILGTVESIKKQTSNNNLYPNFHNYCIENKSCDKSCQTDAADFEIPLTPTVNVRNDVCKLSNGSNEQPEEIEDKVMKDMELLFQGSDNENGEEDIFGDFSNERQIMLIMEEINQFGKKETKPSPPENDKIDTVLIENVSEVQISVPKPVSHSKGYTYSKWPCELYFKKKSLREKLDGISERSFELHTKVKESFIEYFGIQSEDEQGLQSPDTSQDFIRSCRQRIIPNVFKHMKPYYVRHYFPAHLLRPLAKHIVYQLILLNQYPDDYEVYLYIKQYFKTRKKIRNYADF